jgi:hypothetical protein
VGEDERPLRFDADGEVVGDGALDVVREAGGCVAVVW